MKILLCICGESLFWGVGPPVGGTRYFKSIAILGPNTACSRGQFDVLGKLERFYMILWCWLKERGQNQSAASDRNNVQSWTWGHIWTKVGWLWKDDPEGLWWGPGLFRTLGRIWFRDWVGQGVRRSVNVPSNWKFRSSTPLKKLTCEESSWIESFVVERYKRETWIKVHFNVEYDESISFLELDLIELVKWG